MSELIRVCTSQEIHELDLRASREYGLETSILMENAGRRTASVVIQEFPRAGIDHEIILFAGKGQNGGDCFVAARHLHCLDRAVRVFVLESEHQFNTSTAENFHRLERLGVPLAQVRSSDELFAFFESSPGPFTVVDGILGTGVKGQLDGLYFDAVELINRLGYPVVSIDVPSGVDGDTGEILGTAIRATLTVSLAFPKRGHFIYPASKHRGRLINVEISFPPEMRKEGQVYLVRPHAMARLLKERDVFAHKNTFGHTLCVGGSPGRLGAIVMAAKGSLAMGSGLVTASTWASEYEHLVQRLPDELMSFPLPEAPLSESEFFRVLQFSALVLGPGLGVTTLARDLLIQLFERYSGALVLDADALNLISEYRIGDFLHHRKGATVLTPHPGEMARLINVSKEEVIARPIEAVQRAVDLVRSTVVLKGASTYIGRPDEKILVNHCPNDGLAKGGSGDVLAGFIGGLLAQGYETLEAATLGVYLHSAAGKLASQRHGSRSMCANDLINSLPEAIRQTEALRGDASLNQGFHELS